MISVKTKKPPSITSVYRSVKYNMTLYDDSFISYRKITKGRNLKETLSFKRHLSHSQSIFMDLIYTIPQGMKLSPISLRSIQIDNAGGNSNISEMVSIEYYIRLFGATDFLLEMEIHYILDYKMVDYICNIGRCRVGVSVTRAMGYPSPKDFTYQKALRLLHKKLYGLIVARNAVCRKHSFTRSILHVWCQTTKIARMVKKAYSSFDIYEYGLDIKGIVLLHLTVCSDSYIYNNTFVDT